MRVNMGCGMTPTPGWMNFDNSISVRLAKHRGLVRLLFAVGALNGGQMKFLDFAAKSGIRWADATRIPLPPSSVEVLYSCHMLEHLHPEAARRFLAEAHRVLKPAGLLRIAVPDLGRLVRSYLEEGDADKFLAATLLAAPARAGVWERVKFLLVGDRHHRWMYDGGSLSRLLEQSGFAGARIMAPGDTNIVEPGSLDLHERAEESVYIEATRRA